MAAGEKDLPQQIASVNAWTDLIRRLAEAAAHLLGPIRPVKAAIEAAVDRTVDEGWLDGHMAWMRRSVKAAKGDTARRRPRPIRMNPTRSSSIEAAGYDRERQTLRIRYVRGSTYDYVAVPASVFEDFLEADSKGRFVNWSIKPFYRYARVR